MSRDLEETDRRPAGEAARAHWEQVHATRDPVTLSWYQPVPARSLELIREAGIGLEDPLLDVGGGSSTLVDHLLADGHTDLTVLDIAAPALDRARARLGDRADRVHWIVADITGFRSDRTYRLWHDRAVFHFLTDPARRAAYLDVLEAALVDGGHLVLATFGPEGPARCSGLQVQRYSVAELCQVLGSRFTLVRSLLEDHVTPSGSHQQFLYGRWTFRPAPREGS